MKTGVHPKWYEKAKITCACGNTFTIGATVPEMTLDVCSACHPFYTGTMKYLDTAGRVDAFLAKEKGAAKKVLSKADRRAIKREKKLKKELDRPDSLEELRKNK